MTAALRSPGISRVYFLVAKTADALTPRMLARIMLVSLASHAENVRCMVAAWKRDDQSPRWDEVVHAAEHHDDAKPGKFSLTWSTSDRKFGYSFAGHRFHLAAPDVRADSYAARLIREHHTFATEDVVRAAADFLPDRDAAWRFAHDLYVLEVCDNLAADVETRACAPDEGKERDFVECSLRPTNASDRFVVEPWPFEGDAVALKVARLAVPVEGETRAALDDDLGATPAESKLTRLRDRLVHLATDPGEPWETMEVTLCSR